MKDYQFVVAKWGENDEHLASFTAYFRKAGMDWLSVFGEGEKSEEIMDSVCARLGEELTALAPGRTLRFCMTLVDGHIEIACKEEK